MRCLLSMPYHLPVMNWLPSLDWGCRWATKDNLNTLSSQAFCKRSHFLIKRWVWRITGWLRLAGIAWKHLIQIFALTEWARAACLCLCPAGFWISPWMGSFCWLSCVLSNLLLFTKLNVALLDENRANTRKSSCSTKQYWSLDVGCVTMLRVMFMRQAIEELYSLSQGQWRHQSSAVFILWSSCFTEHSLLDHFALGHS